MPRVIQAPEESDESSPQEGTRIRHPAFALIGASRMSGRSALFASDFTHDHFIRLRIRACDHIRSLSHNWYHGRDAYIEVDMTEAQWVTFVSTMNSGSGVPCTLVELGPSSIPGIPDPPKSQSIHIKEMQERINQALAEFTTVKASIESLSVSASKKREIVSSIDTIKRQLEDNLPFVAKCFGEHMENIVESAKSEMTAYAVAHFARLGVPIAPSQVLQLPETTQ